MDLSDFKFFGGQGIDECETLTKVLEFDGVPTKVDFFTQCPGIGEAEGETKHLEMLSVKVDTQDHIRGRYARRRRLNFQFLDGGIEEVMLESEVKTKSGVWVRAESVYKFNQFGIFGFEDLKLTLYEKQACFLDESLVPSELEGREQALHFVSGLATVGVGYASQILGQVRDSSDRDDLVLADKLERVVLADHDLRIAKSLYELKPESYVDHNTVRSYGDSLDAFGRFGIEVKKGSADQD